jgi:hypothetical protein
MKTLKSVLSPLAAALCVVLLAPPMNAAAEEGAGSDHAFNEMLGKMAGRDTGSGWFDYYVEVLNQEIAQIDGREAYGAAGPSGPLDGFNGYIGGFRMPDTGSTWFNNYVDAVNFVIQQKDAAAN